MASTHHKVGHLALYVPFWKRYYNTLSSVVSKLLAASFKCQVRMDQNDLQKLTLTKKEELENSGVKDLGETLARKIIM